MSKIAEELEKLLYFARQKQLISEEDVIPVRNALIALLQLKEPEQNQAIVQEEFSSALPIMEKIMEYCIENNRIQDNTTERDLMDAKIMGILMPRASEVAHRFFSLYKTNPQTATDYFFNLSKDANYIQTSRIAKNLYWQAETEYGNLEITVNLSKPEKDPEEIAKAKLLPQSNYPKCLICAENAGFAGHLNHPARQNLRLIPLTLNNEKWYFQYSPYSYYNEHCIILNSQHVPMKLARATFVRLLEFVKQFPHYFIGSNADLPIVGGSILTHDHFQGGRHTFAMETAEVFMHYKHDSFPDINISQIKWPMSVVRLATKLEHSETLIEMAMLVFEKWKHYSDESAGVLAFSGETPHNTITPIVRVNQEGLLEMDLVLRNNRTSEEHPLGIFHPHANLHHIKKENIGLIEVMGLAVLPGRLESELQLMEGILCGISSIEEIGNESHPLFLHLDWLQKIVSKYGVDHSRESASEILKTEVGHVFKQVLEDAGVFKCNEEGCRQYHSFMTNMGAHL